MDNSKLLFEKENENNNAVSTNSFSTYLNDISRYPLLSIEEEIKYATMLEESKDSKLLVFNDCGSNIVSSLNTPLLFRSLNNNESYKNIINDLLVLYASTENNTKETVDIYQYIVLSNKLNRSLNGIELKDVFNIDDGEILNDIDLMVEVKKYMLYKLAYYKMFVSNLRLVVHFAKKYQMYMDMSDLISEGNIGLMRAIQKYDVSLGNKFSTYASSWIMECMKRACVNNSFIRIPETMNSSLNTFKRNVDALEMKYSRKLTDDEIAHELSMPIESVRENYKHLEMYRTVSLDKPINEDDDATMQDIITDNDNLEESVMSNSLQEEIKKLLSTLTDREQEIIKMRFGIGKYNGKEHTLVEVSKVLSVSPSRVRQTEIKALIKLKRLTKSSNNELKLYLK